GDLTVDTESWATPAKQEFAVALARGESLETGRRGAKACEGWRNSSSAATRCARSADATAHKRCASGSAAPQTAPMGGFVGGAVIWDTHSKERIEALELPFKVIHAGSAAALFAEIQSAVKRKQPIVAWAWQPSWVTTKYDGHFVDFPKYESDC